MSKPWQILSVQWGQNHLKIWPQKCVFLEKLDSLTLTNTIQGIFLPCVVGGTCGQNLIPTWTVPTEFWGSWGVSNHPQYQHQNDHFWLKLNYLTLTFNKWVNFFSLLMGRTCGQNLVPTWTIPTKFWGCWGGVKPPPVPTPKWPFSAHNSQAPTLWYFWHPSDFFYRTELRMHIRNNFLVEQNISRSTFFFKLLFTFDFGGCCWIWDNPTFSLWLAITSWGKILKLKTR